MLLYDDGQNSTYAAPPKLESGGGGLAGTAADYPAFLPDDAGRRGAGRGAIVESQNRWSYDHESHLPQAKEITQMMPNTGNLQRIRLCRGRLRAGVAVTVNLAHAALPGTVGEYAWGGAAATYFFCDPKEDLAVIFMTQILAAPERIRLRRDLRSLVYGAMAESFA